MLRRTKLRSVSKKRAKVNKEYLKLRAEFLRNHRYCMVWLMENGEDGHALSEEYAKENNGLFRLNSIPSQCPLAQDIHHVRHRGKYLLDTSTWLAVSRFYHEKIHQNPSWARSKGYLV